VTALKTAYPTGFNRDSRAAWRDRDEAGLQAVAASAWDEGHEVGGNNYGEGDYEANPYRVASTEGSES
jgi:hypothetical protein